MPAKEKIVRVNSVLQELVQQIDAWSWLSLWVAALGRRVGEAIGATDVSRAVAGLLGWCSVSGCGSSSRAAGSCADGLAICLSVRLVCRCLSDWCAAVAPVGPNANATTTASVV
jgi:hypothetical protein